MEFLNSHPIYAASIQTITPAKDGEILIIVAAADKPVELNSEAKMLIEQLGSNVQSIKQNPLLKDLNIRIQQSTILIPNRSSARLLADASKATLVIWSMASDDTLTVHYEITPRWKQPIQANATLGDTYPPIKTIEVLEHATLQFEHKIDSSYTMIFTSALVLYSDKQYQVAQSLFENIAKAAQRETYKRLQDLAIAEVWYYIGLIRQVSQRNMPYAEQAYNQALLLNPQLAEAYVDRGLVRIVKNRFVEAVVDYTMAIALNPNDDFAYLQRSGCLNNLEKYDLAIADVVEAININPQNANAYNDLGGLHANQGKFEEAENDFSLAIAHYPMFAMAYV
ncbi:MAG: tetratricopeptide repeat protein, partial [Anaerolineae bacterium]|nr:tetratricopeptide repeat protein [Anaerolineae bacterium]